ncbi:MAG: hypothetical protein SXU28_05355 [Pseudomonadota bacterium]|nr:hypothetical protein [Pseudomonadota bacterium]
MRRISLAAVLGTGLMLSACSSETSGTFEGEDGETGEYSIDEGTGEASATIETEAGTATMRSGSTVPVDLPAGFTLYPGAEVVTNTVVSQGEGQGALLTMTSSDSPEEVAAFYKQQAEKAGVEIQMELSVNDGKMIGGASPDGLTFSINASPSPEGTSAQLAVGTDFGG